jgi:hypothetical protein
MCQPQHKMITNFWWQVLTKCLHLYIFEINGHLVPGQKYVHMSKNNEIVSKNMCYLVINIVGNNDNFHFIL